MKDGIPVTETVKCSNGKCKDGQCGYCTSKSDCNGAASCSCKDGTSVGVFVSYDCISNQCQQTSSPDCGTACQDHGGAQ